MEIDYRILEREIIDILEKNPVWVLSTSLNDYVTSRPMSIVHMGLDIYFQTNQRYTKHEQMVENRQVSLCCQNVSIEGNAESIGDWDNAENAQIRELYKSRHPGPYGKYGKLDGQLIYRVTPVKLKLWKYIDGESFREIGSVNEQRAVRLGILSEPFT